MPKIAKNRLRGAFGARLDLRYDLGSDVNAIFADFYGFGEDLESILGGFGGNKREL